MTLIDAPVSASEPSTKRHPESYRSDADPSVPADQVGLAAHTSNVAGDDPSAAIDHGSSDDQSRPVGGGISLNDPEREWLDANLRLYSDTLDDLEATRIANENRCRSLARAMLARFDPDHPILETRAAPIADLIAAVDSRAPGAKDMAKLAAVAEGIGQLEHDATLLLQRAMRSHPLGPWVKSAMGVGDKQAGRLLGVLGDPYIVPDMYDRDGNLRSSARIRTVSQLWAYCGYHVLHPGHTTHDTQAGAAGVEPSGPTDQARRDTHAHSVGGATSCGPGHTNPVDHPFGAGVAPSRRKGQRANWNSTAKMRAFLVAEATTKRRCATCTAAGKVRADTLGKAPPWAPPPLDCTCADDGYRYRVVYDAARMKYQHATHDQPCVRCGPKGTPAELGSEISEKHKQARAVRAVAKEILRDLWRESKRLHEERAAGA